MSPDSGPTPLRISLAIGGGLVFAASLLYFAVQYAVGFDALATGEGLVAPVLSDLVLFSIFALHHSIFARTGFKAALTRVVPLSMERSTYVWIASLLFILVCWAWQPVPGVVWNISGPVAWTMRAVQLFAVAFTLVAARRLDVLELSGVRQALEMASDRLIKLDDRGPFALVRHPIYLGWVAMVWAAPQMNGTRLAFAAISTLYLLIAIPFEERDLRRTFGEAYGRYADRVRAKIVPWVY